MEETLETNTTLFRPPYGMMKNSQARLISQSKKIVMWNVLSGDYDLSLNPSCILKRTLQHIQPGCIVLFHDQQKTKGVLKQVLPDFLDFLEEKGFKTGLL